MGYDVRYAPIGARLGEGIGTGLSESIPKEMERGRLREGLSQFAQQSPTLTPLQQMAMVSSIPGVTPQMIQTMGELARMQALGQGIKQAYGGTGVPTGSPGIPRKIVPGEEETVSPYTPSEVGRGPDVREIPPTLVSPEMMRAEREPFIPRTPEEKIKAASRNPLFERDPQAALRIEEEKDEAQRRVWEAQRETAQLQRASQQRISEALRSQRERFGPGMIPEDVYGRIENRAIDAVRRGELTDDQAAKFYGDELRNIGRDYSKIKSLRWSWFPTGKKAETRRQIEALRKNFSERNDLENFADSLVAHLRITPAQAYSLAYPIHENPEVKNSIERLRDFSPKLKSIKNLSPRGKELLSEHKNDVQERVFPDLAKKMGKEGSPLAIARNLEKKGYSGFEFLNYLDKNRRELNLSERQIRELGADRSALISLGDIWIDEW